MNERSTKTALAGLLAAACLVASCKDSAEPPAVVIEADARPGITVVTHARFHAVDDAEHTFESAAMAFSEEGIIEGIGDSGAILAAFPGAEVIDLGGRTVIPGLIDSHAHLVGLAQSFTRANLVGTRSVDEVIERLREFESSLPEGAWLLGRGWDQNDWPEQVFPDRHVLDAAFPDRAVWLRRIDGHAGWANDRAIAEADRDLAGDWQEEGGFIHRDDGGEPTGIFIDKAMGWVERAVPPDSPELMSRALDMATHALVSRGLTGVHEAGTSLESLRLYQSKISAGDLPLRIYAMADGVNEALDWLCENGPYAHPSGLLQMRSVKLYADGALGSRGAALLADYSDDPGNRGLMFMDAETLDAQIDRVLSCGLQVGVHAIGDRANREVLDALARVAPDYPDNPGRHRLEHAQILSPSDIPRFAELGVIAAMQPTHATSDMYWAGERLGEERLAGAYAWHSLDGHGAHLALGSDFPVEAVDPMLGLYAYITRQDLEGWPEGGWQPQERMSRADALRGFTLDAAWAGFMEDTVGSLEVGKQADFVVLDRDIMTVPPREIPETQVLQTWVGGNKVYERL